MNDSFEQLDTTNTADRQILDLREIGMEHALALGKFHYTKVAPGLKSQCHRDWLVLQFALSGTHSYFVDGQEFEFRGGQGFRILPGQEYRSRFQNEQRGELVWLILKLNPLSGEQGLGMSAKGFREVCECLIESGSGPRFSYSEGTRQEVKEIFEAWEGRECLLNQELIRNRIASLVISTARVLKQSAIRLTEDSVNADRVRTVLAWLESNLGEELSVEAMAEVSGLSVPHFFREFKRYTGTSPNDYFLKLRIDRAAVCLREDRSLTVTEVAYRMGFSSSQYFSTVFRRYRGVSPSAWREG